MGSCKGRHLEHDEWIATLILRALGFSTRTIAEVLGVHHESLRERFERLRERFIRCDFRDFEDMIDLLKRIKKEPDSDKVMKFARIFGRCLEIYEGRQKRFRRREEEIIDTTIKMLI